MPDIPISSEIIPAFIDVWSVPEIIETLFKLSDRGLYQDVRRLLEEPLQKIPEYLLLTIGKCQFEGGHILLDDILSALMPIFLANQ